MDMNRIVLLLCTALIFWLGCFVLYPYHFALPYFETDFVDYCVGLSQWTDNTRHFPPKRSRLAGWLPSLFTPSLGVLNSLSVGSMISMFVMAAGLTQWMESVNKWAGWSCLGWLLACSPWIGLGQFLNFYPEIVVGLMMGTMAVWFGLLTPVSSTDSPGNDGRAFWKGLLVGTGIGLCALIDVRGLVWAGWFVVLTLGWKLWQRQTWRSNIAFCSGWIGSLYGMWYLGRFAYGPYSTSLIRQADIRPLRFALGLAPSLDNAFPIEFRWGWEWRGLVDNIAFIASQQTSGLPNQDLSNYWWIWLVLIAATSLWIVKRHALLILVLIPSMVAFLQIGHAVETHVRFYMQSLPILMGVLGVGTSYLLPTQHRRRIPILIAIGLLLPYTSMMLGQHWIIEREISHKMLSQAHPNHSALQQRSIVYGDPLHIQTLPITQVERQITQDWDMVCTEALQQHTPILWFERQ